MASFLSVCARTGWPVVLVLCGRPVPPPPPGAVERITGRGRGPTRTPICRTKAHGGMPVLPNALASARRAPIPGMHLFSADSANAEQEQPSDTDDSPLPSPEQWTLGRLSETEAAEMIERHIEYVTPFESEPVHLPAAFVRHFMRRTGTHDLHVLPTISAVATMPIVLADGTVLALDGLDRERGIDFHVPPEMLGCRTKRERCR